MSSFFMGALHRHTPIAAVHAEGAPFHRRTQWHLDATKAPRCHETLVTINNAYHTTAFICSHTSAYLVTHDVVKRARAEFEDLEEPFEARVHKDKHKVSAIGTAKLTIRCGGFSTTHTCFVVSDHVMDTEIVLGCRPPADTTSRSRSNMGSGVDVPSEYTLRHLRCNHT